MKWGKTVEYIKENKENRLACSCWENDEPVVLPGYMDLCDTSKERITIVGMRHLHLNFFFQG